MTHSAFAQSNKIILGQSCPLTGAAAQLGICTCRAKDIGGYAAYFPILFKVIGWPLFGVRHQVTVPVTTGTRDGPRNRNGPQYSGDAAKCVHCEL